MELPLLKKLYQEMSDLTAPECATNCRVPHSCCDEMYCEMADERAKELGIVLERTGHTSLPFMGPTGCTVEPYLRPNCTFHTCAINGFGFKPGDLGWTQQYFNLRAKIEEEENADYLRRADRR